MVWSIDRELGEHVIGSLENTLKTVLGFVLGELCSKKTTVVAAYDR